LEAKMRSRCSEQTINKSVTASIDDSMAEERCNDPSNLRVSFEQRKVLKPSSRIAVI
jgi:hypothetical protein